MNTVAIDLGDKIIKFLAEKLQVEDIWSARQPRKLTCWPYRLAVTIWADPMREDHGHFLTKISARTDMLKNVPPTENTFATFVLAQPEMEKRRSPLVSIPPFGRGFSRHEGLSIR